MTIYIEPLYSQIRYRYGCVDDILQVFGRAVRHCNWVRFIQPPTSGLSANIIAVRVRGETHFIVTEQIVANTELSAAFSKREYSQVPTVTEVLEDMKMDSQTKEKGN